MRERAHPGWESRHVVCIMREALVALCINKKRNAVRDLLWVSRLCPVIGGLRKAVLGEIKMPVSEGMGSALGVPEAAGLSVSKV
ncbi:hypothetical protein CVIRNUC_000260 [Coccomyxa viridis]|uniref:Uncharacterized protein n=1 Tax=Coccomyxa viridis TaxID=1274662 RepID=A0AAV1HQW4_9CHLO|nr:hypothetical protein CVIRNUC_000260 [Coccomyxa viridis]